MKNVQVDYHTFIFNINAEYTNATIKDYLFAADFSAALLRRIKVKGKVFLNNQESPLYKNIRGGDVLLVDIGRETLNIGPEDQKITIVFEDDDLLVINKKPFVVTHPVRRYPTGTLANGVAFYLQKQGIETNVRFINRLDKNTSGLVLVSKNLYAHEFIQKQFRARIAVKKYWAVVSGNPVPPTGIIKAPIAREEQRSIVRLVREDGQEAVTHYKILEEFQDTSLVELTPKTGRTHQLRVHLSYLGHPILGDDLYNPEVSALINRQALHAKEIGFFHPRAREWMVIRGDLQEDIAHLILQLKENGYT
ncbi:MAG: RluA family pseudouridine synthase [Peptococcaceae bacterium]